MDTLIETASPALVNVSCQTSWSSGYTTEYRTARTAVHVCGGVTKNAFGGRIPEDDPTVTIGQEDTGARATKRLPPAQHQVPGLSQ
jgi:hypothetical protein